MPSTPRAGALALGLLCTCLLACGSEDSLRRAGNLDIAGNRGPELTRVQLSPLGELRVGETLRVDAEASDPDGHDVHFEYTWWVNGRRLRGGGKSLAADRLAVGDQVEVAVRASDGVEWSAVERVGPVTRVNTRPEFRSDPPALLQGASVSYRARAHDPDDARRLRFDLVEAPPGARIDPLTGLFEWSRAEGVGGPFPVVIAVEDWRGGRATQAFEVGGSGGALARSH